MRDVHFIVFCTKSPELLLDSYQVQLHRIHPLVGFLHSEEAKFEL